MGVLRATLRKPAVAGLVIAIVVTLGVVEARHLGLLLRPELVLHDALLRLQPNATAAPERVTLIRIREEDIARYGHPLPDATLADAVERILAAEPRAIGIDLYRDLPVGGGQERLRRLVLERTRVIGIEKFPDRDRPGTPPPAWLQGSQQVGFSDLTLDDDGVVRRALLFLWDDQDRMHVSLALRLALLHLGDEGLTLASNDPNGEVLRVGRAELRPFRAGDGAYASADDRGYQVLLDHRRGIRPFESRSIAELLDGVVPAAELQDRVVILGTSAPSVKDAFLTPFVRAGGGRWMAQGMEVHAQVVDQLLRRALDGDPAVRSPDMRVQMAGVLLLCLLGAALGLGAPSVRLVWVGALAVVCLLVAAAWIALGRTYWLPVVPPLLGFVASTGFAVAHVLREERREKALLRELFSRHVSRGVLDELWRKREQFMQEGRLRTQRMTITVLMSDLQGYAEASEKLEPDVLLDWVNEFMGALARLVERKGGMVDDYWGDGLKANFGVPVARTTTAEIEVDARAAVGCAREMARAMEQLNDGWCTRGLPTGRLRVGIHTGPVVVGSVGSTERLKYTSVGDTVNVAARLESLDREAFVAEGGARARVLMSDETHRLLGVDVAATSLGARSMAGRAQPVEVWRLLLDEEP